MANKSREMLKALLPDLSSIKGTVEIPSKFNETSSFGDSSSSDLAYKKIKMVLENSKDVNISYKEKKLIKEKFNKMLDEFYAENYDILKKVELSSLSKHFQDSVKLVRVHQEVVPQYYDFKSKTAGMLFGFFINHSVRQQNELNKRYATVCEVFGELAEERFALSEQIRDAYSRLKKLEEEKGVKA